MFLFSVTSLLQNHAVYTHTHTHTDTQSKNKSQNILSEFRIFVLSLTHSYPGTHGPQVGHPGLQSRQAVLRSLKIPRQVWL